MCVTCVREQRKNIYRERYIERDRHLERGRGRETDGRTEIFLISIMRCFALCFIEPIYIYIYIYIIKRKGTE